MIPNKLSYSLMEDNFLCIGSRNKLWIERTLKYLEMNLNCEKFLAPIEKSNLNAIGCMFIYGYIGFIYGKDV